MLTDDTGLSSKDTAHRYTDPIVHEVSVTVLPFLSKLTYVYSYLCICLCSMLPLPYLSASASDTFVTASAYVDVLSSHLLSVFHRFRLSLTPPLPILQSLFQPPVNFPRSPLVRT